MKRWCGPNLKEQNGQSMFIAQGEIWQWLKRVCVLILIYVRLKHKLFLPVTVQFKFLIVLQNSFFCCLVIFSILSSFTIFSRDLKNSTQIIVNLPTPFFWYPAQHYCPWIISLENRAASSVLTWRKPHPYCGLSLKIISSLSFPLNILTAGR